MPHHDLEQRRECDRNRKRRRRIEAAEVMAAGTAGRTESDSARPPEEFPLEPSATDLLRALAGEVRRLQAWDGDALLRAKALATLGNVILRIIETSNLEKRLEALEAEQEARAKGWGDGREFVGETVAEARRRLSGEVRAG